MGAITFSLDAGLLDFFVAALGIEVFVETGTFEGDSVAIASRKLAECHSVELSREHFDAAQRRFVGRSGVHLYQGDSAAVLRDLVPRLGDRPVFYWLDAHWCAVENTAGEDSKSPLLREIEAIEGLGASSVLCIDDARLYLCPPPAPHRYTDWPAFHELLTSLLRCAPDHRIMVLNDVLVVYPVRIHEALCSFAFENAVDWAQLASRALRSTQTRSGRPLDGVASAPRDRSRLPIGVVVPTLNTMSLLPDHVQTMRGWLDLVDEVIVVDSDSTDGSTEFLKQELKHPRVRFFSRPRGLYQAWNFGVEQVSSAYTYVSTVGDAISRAGLIHLHEVASRFDADVVISPPDFVNEQGCAIESMDWPIHRLIRMLGIDEPELLDRWTAFGFAFVSISQAILGSSASNLYRTVCLQRAPFPFDFGSAGDTAWGLQNALHVNLALTPYTISSFREHEKPYGEAEGVVADQSARLEALAERSFEHYLAGDPAPRASREERIVANMLLHRSRARSDQGLLSELRAGGKPRGWGRETWRDRRVRRRRNRARTSFQRFAMELLQLESRLDEAAMDGAMKHWIKWASAR